eukprot:307652_1
MTYCNFDDFQFELSCSMRKLNENENAESLKKRHSNYANTTKNLREIVQFFGTRIKDGETKSFYNGMNKEFYFLSILSSIKGCLSTSKEVNVAMYFAQNKGIIIELNGCSNKYFDCMYLSKYTAEKELFFIG